MNVRRWQPRMTVRSSSKTKGVADAGAHGTMLTDAVSNTTLLAHYVRDREAAMPIELAVYKSSLAAAEIYHLVRSFPPPAAQRRPYAIALPIRPPYDSHSVQEACD
jgi:hypothetical protein